MSVLVSATQAPSELTPGVVSPGGGSASRSGGSGVAVGWRQLGSQIISQLRQQSARRSLGHILILRLAPRTPARPSSHQLAGRDPSRHKSRPKKAAAAWMNLHTNRTAEGKSGAKKGAGIRSLPAFVAHGVQPEQRGRKEKRDHQLYSCSLPISCLSLYSYSSSFEDWPRQQVTGLFGLADFYQHGFSCFCPVRWPGPYLGPFSSSAHLLTPVRSFYLLLLLSSIVCNEIYMYI